MTWPTSTPTDYESAERYAIEHEDDPLPPEVQRHWFISRLFSVGDGWTELRAIRRDEPNPKRRTKRAFFPAGDLAGIESFVARFGENRDLYVAVAARRTRDNGRLKNCGTVRVLWCDLDFKETPEDAARAALARFIHVPDMEVRSGGGLHLYWRLGPVDLQVEAEDFKRRLIGTARAIGGDEGSAEPAHILRLPGTLNFKYTPPREVSLAGF